METTSKKKKNTSKPSLPPGVVSDSQLAISADDHKTPKQSLAEVEVVESTTTTITSSAVSVEVPLLHLNGYAKRRVDCFFTGSSAEGWKAAYLGLEQQEAKLSNGKLVANVQDAIRWVGEQFAAR